MGGIKTFSIIKLLFSRSSLYDLSLELGQYRCYGGAEKWQVRERMIVLDTEKRCLLDVTFNVSSLN